MSQLSILTTGEFPDEAHRDHSNFVTYAHVIINTQPSIPRSIKNAMKLPEAELWRTAAQQEPKSLQELDVYELVPLSAAPQGKETTGNKWVFHIKPNTTDQAGLGALGWTRLHAKDC